ncbi:MULTISPECIES: hypothetical protein [Comamonas]|uniref:Uncharacterized protein n=1 Tax=Comamonas testosteroni TaxID=285 RepID=A0A096FMU8_COMTE|nr:MULTISPECIES: hypothetical protein [Comamonas]KGH31073.1 hypothetical protein P353_07070 [Comamonas testosteroni]MPT11552.1 hypothetical protein [Comamonas sp.]
MKSFFAALLTMEGVLTLGLCVALELIIIFIVYQYFHNIAGSLAFSLIVFGPASLFVGPKLYRYFSR